MNIVVQELAKKQSKISIQLDLQEFLLALLTDVEKYFKAAPPMTEEKAYANISTIFTRIAREFSLISSVKSTSKRLIKDLRDKISDVFISSLRNAKMGDLLQRNH